MFKDDCGLNFSQILLEHMVLDRRNDQLRYWMTCRLSKTGALPTGSGSAKSIGIVAAQMMVSILIVVFCTGSYVKPSGIISVDNIWDRVVDDGFAAVSLEGYKNVAVIAKVRKTENETVKIHYWKGSWDNKWQPSR
jgi:hypothetical protein